MTSTTGVITGGRRIDAPAQAHWLRCDGFGVICAAAIGPFESADRARVEALNAGWLFFADCRYKQLCSKCAKRRLRSLRYGGGE